MKIRVQSTPRGKFFQKYKVAFVFYFPLLDKPFIKSVFKHFPKKLRILDISRLDITETYKYL